MPIESSALAEKISQTLVEPEWILGTIEVGTDGRVSHVIFATDYGPDILGSSLVVEEPTEAVDALELPRPQLKKAGDFSAKAARAAAREGRGLLGVHVCLVVWAGQPIDEEAQGETVYLAVNVNDELSEQELTITDPDPLEQVVAGALTLLAKALRLD